MRRKLARPSILWMAALVAIAGLWLRSEARFDQVGLAWGGYTIGIASFDGAAGIVLDSLEDYRGAYWETGVLDTFGPPPSRLFDRSGRHVTVCGFTLDWGYRGFYTPYWFWFVIAASYCAWRARRRMRRPAQQLCPACGYDLRGSPGPACPECGAARVG